MYLLYLLLKITNEQLFFFVCFTSVVQEDDPGEGRLL